MILRALYGDRVTELGTVEYAEVGHHTALALSPGRFPKRHPTIDANEDAVLVGAAGDRTLLAVADGHHGFTVAETVITACEHLADDVLAAQDRGLAGAFAELVRTVEEEVESALQRVQPPRQDAGAACSIAVISGRRLLATTMGDSAVLAVDTRGRVRRIGKPAPFLNRVAPPSVIKTTRLRRGERVVCATDGLLDYLGGGLSRLANAGAMAAEPLQAVEHLVSTAFGVGAADHLAVCIWFPADDRPASRRALPGRRARGGVAGRDGDSLLSDP